MFWRGFGGLFQARSQCSEPASAGQNFKNFKLLLLSGISVTLPCQPAATYEQILGV